MDNNLLILAIVGTFVGASSGYLGSFMVLKRMSLVGDALSHVALPGIAVALTFGINPMLGAFVALFLATFAIWYLSENSEIYPEALVGVFFTASLSLGLLITPEPELLEALFGDIDKINGVDALFVVLGSILIFTITHRISKKLILGVVSEDLARSQGISTSKINLVYLLMVSLAVTIGVKFLGTLLTGALVIIPAVTAKNLSESIKSFQIVAVFTGIISALFGIVISKFFGISSGPAIILTSVALFAFSYLYKRN